MTELQMINDIINNNETNETTKSRKSYYIKLGTKSTGRPKRKLEEGQDINDLRNEWNKNWREKRGSSMLSIAYMKKRYGEQIPSELFELPQATDEELTEKHRLLCEKVKQIKNEKYKNEIHIRKQKNAERRALKEQKNSLLEAN